MLCKGGDFSTCKGISVKVADTVGSGDSFLAAVISKLMERASADETLQFANHLAAFVTTQKGACPDYDGYKLAEFSNNAAH